MTKIAFPGLGINEFTVNSTAFTLPIFGGLEVKWYGIIITLGIVLAFAYCSYRAKQEGIKFDDLLDVAIFTIIFAVIGARGGYVLFSLDKYTKYMEEGFFKMLYKMINIRDGGLQIYGAIIVGALTIFIVCKVKKMNVLKMLDSVGPAVMIGQFIGRWGNFMNGEAHGSIVSESSPLYFLRMRLYPYYLDGKLNYNYGEVHPTFLYESLWNMVGFLIIHLLYKKKKFDGQIVLMYLAWYGFGRMLIETLRTDSLTIGNTGIRISVLIGAICFLGGVALLIVGFVKVAKKKDIDEAYAPTYAKISHYKDETAEIKDTAQATEEKEEENNTDAKSSEQDNSSEEESTSDAESKEDIEKRLSKLFGDNDENK